LTEKKSLHQREAGAGGEYKRFFAKEGERVIIPDWNGLMQRRIGDGLFLGKSGCKKRTLSERGKKTAGRRKDKQDGSKTVSAGFGAPAKKDFLNVPKEVNGGRKLARE